MERRIEQRHVAVAKTLETLLEYVKGSATSSAQLLSKARVTWKAFERGR